MNVFIFPGRCAKEKRNQPQKTVGELKMSRFFSKLEFVKGKDLLSVFVMLAALPYALVLKLAKPNLWLICEDRNEARDNGFWLYRYLRKNRPEQDVVYAINKKAADYRKVKDLGKVITYGGYSHWAHYFAAKQNISSQKGGKPNAAVCYFLEVYLNFRKNRVFLQHGITINAADFLRYENTKMRLFICGAKKEYEYVRGHFGYPENNLAYTGFSRFDGLHDLKIKEKQLLIMPTWREWIATPSRKSKTLDNMEDFTTTEYFLRWSELLKDEEFIRMTKEAGVTVIFYPHRDMHPFLSYFSSSAEHIIIAAQKDYDVQALLKESAFLITDYSSISMDFGYMQKPMIYYQFDYEKFRRGQYPEGYFSYKNNGFGPVCQTPEELNEQIRKAIDSDFANPEEYAKREAEFFELRDKDNCRRIDEAIRALS